MRKMLSILAVIAAGFFVAAPALAHVTVKPDEAIAGVFSAFVVQVPNERDDAATTKVEVEFPPAFASVSFQDKPGWTRKVTMVEFDEPIEAFGEQITEGVGTVTWSGGKIEPGEFETFGFSVGPVPEGELEFKALQTYDSGEVVRWIGPPDAEQPAARVTAYDLGLEEGGQLAALTELEEQVEEMAPTHGSDEEASDDSDRGTILGGVGIVLGGAALITALRKRA